MSEDYLRRFTDLTALMYLLHERKITLLDPASWDDKNDSHYFTLYSIQRKAQALFGASALFHAGGRTIPSLECNLRPVRAGCASSSNAVS